MNVPSLIAFDLDGTLLNVKKKITPATDEALQAIHARGAQIVIATGRFYAALPDALRTLPYVRYFITVNGAEVYDRAEDRVLSRAEIPNMQAIKIMEFFDTLPVIYDCYQGNAAWMSAAMLEQAAEFSANDFYRGMMRLRHPVPDLKTFLAENGRPVQKTMCLFRDMELRRRLLSSMQGQFPDTVVTSSIPNNIELNHKDATKGKALLTLAETLGIPRERTAAFGDDLNDVSMLRAAGIGVAMGNASDEVKAAADLVTDDCDRDGVAKTLWQWTVDS